MLTSKDDTLEASSKAKLKSRFKHVPKVARRTKFVCGRMRKERVYGKCKTRLRLVSAAQRSRRPAAEYVWPGSRRFQPGFGSGMFLCRFNPFHVSASDHRYFISSYTTHFVILEALFRFQNPAFNNLFTVVQNSQESRRKYWATCLSACSFTRTTLPCLLRWAHLFA